MTTLHATHEVSQAETGGHPQLEGGLTITQRGYTLQLERRTLERGPQVELAFRILGPDARPVSRFDIVHERPLHLIVVRRDFAAYEHTHPALDAQGRWSVLLDLSMAGTYRVVADFSTGGTALVLGADLFVAGTFTPAADPVAVATARSGEYAVELTPIAGDGLERELVFRVQRNGAPAGDLAPYLGAMGHLMALREGDLALQHVHPLTSAVDTGVRFHAAFPSPGRYRLFFEFAAGGAVHRTCFVLDLPYAASGTAPHRHAHGSHAR